jgi:hypothetical protein
MLDRRNATPSEYLKRMALHIAVFGSDLQFEGVTISAKPSMIIGQPSGQPSIVISQRWYEKDGVATNEAIHDFLVDEGFRSVPPHISDGFDRVMASSSLMQNPTISSEHPLASFPLTCRCHNSPRSN